MARSPVFIVGSPRSGTSILVDTMLAAGYHGFREGNFLSLITPLSTLIERYFSVFAGNKAVLITNIDKEAFKASVFETLRVVTSELNPVAPWFDKSGNPEMILSIPVLRRLWPDSVYIFAKRRGLENVVSRLKKFPAHSFDDHCVGWAKNMTAWRSVRHSLPASCFMEIDQQDIIQMPDDVAIRLRAFLNFDSREQQNVASTLRSNRPQQTEADSASRLLSLTTCGWSDQQIAIFLKHCQAEMDAYRYTMDVTYRLKDAQVSSNMADAPRATVT